MPRKTTIVPKLFKRGKKGYYYFRRCVDGKDKWICTETDDAAKARSKAKSIIEAEDTLKALNRAEDNATKLAHTFVKSVTGKESFTMELAQAHEYWTGLMPEYSDISESTRSLYKSIFSRFASWCQQENLTFIEQIDQSTALRYAKTLWESGITPRTYNGHLKQLSRVFDTIDAINHLPHRNPFNSKSVERKVLIVCLDNLRCHFVLRAPVI